MLSIRTEQIRENLDNSLASARNRACKHAFTNLHGVNATNLFSVVSTPPSPLKPQLETRLDDVQATTVSLVEAPAPRRNHKRGRSKTERRANQSRQDNSVSRRGRSRCKAKAAADQTPANTNIVVCAPRRTRRRRIVCSKSLRPKSGLTADKAQGDVPLIVLGL